ncbi:MAG: hypothetical protein IID08_00215 [Candidatus Hydrogenedentes bacterium]|nr:hypothetical protein [Candidatus Hydrogenedentota bacterium]
MSVPPPRFPAYGDDGDMAGARRMRRAFRLCVLSFVLLTGIMWLSERFLRYEASEYLYLSALTLPSNSARVMLRQAIKIDKDNREHPTPRYTEALAVRAEDDVILNVYGRAMSLDPTNSLFAIRYGCELFRKNQADKAATQFRTASALPQENALPDYLEAASLAQAGRDLEALSDAMVIVARTNSRRENVVFPRPFWFSGYPQDGYWYANLSHNIVNQACAPLYHFTERVTSTVESQIAQGQTKNAGTWLEQLRLMGQRLALDSEPQGVFQAIAGLTIQMRAIEVLDHLAARRDEPLDESLIESRANLKRALVTLKDFVEARDTLVQDEISEVYAPFKLGGWAAIAFFGTYFLALVMYRIMRYRKTSWAIPHSTLGKWILGGGCAVLFLQLQLLTLFQYIPGSQNDYIGIVGTFWRVTVVALCLFGILYPALTLKGVREVSRTAGRPEEIDETVRYARQAYRRAYAALSLRYYGILWGLYACMFCGWVISYRMISGLYPWQEKLIAAGYLDMERTVVEQALALLG